MANLRIIKQLAKEKNISLEELADGVGISPQALSKIMRNNSTRIETFERICQLLEVSPLVFFDSYRGSTIVKENAISVNGNSNKVNQVDKFLALLSKRDEQIDKRDEHIDRLLTIIEHFNR